MLTENQRSALAARGNVSVTANAGAGKTRVLVERYVEILLTTQTRPTEIAAITFTEKAASELRKKISSNILGRIRDERDPAIRVRLEFARDNLAASPIGTIHSFCARILREYPVEADIDAGFSVLEGHDRELLEGEALQSAMAEMLSGRERNGDEDAILDVIRMAGKKGVESLMHELIRNRDGAERIANGPLLPARSDQEILDAWNHAKTSLLLRLLDTSGWREQMISLSRLADGKKAPEVRTLLEGWKAEMATPEKIERYGLLSHHLFTSEYTPRIACFGSAAKEVQSSREFVALGLFDRDAIRLAKDLRDTNAETADRFLLKNSRTLMRMHERFAAAYEARKSDLGLLDFDDLQFRTIAVLNNPQVREHAAQRYRYVMVDEFQDTNHSQYEILRLLSSGFSLGNLFIVGDPKQSIYGFRNADVGVFQTTIDEMSLSAGGDGAGEIILPESFRLLSGIVLFINAVFADLMREVPGDSGARYDALIRGRQNPAAGGVELMIVTDTTTLDETARADTEEEESDAASECEMIALRLMKLRREGHPIYKESGTAESAVPFQYSDAAILLRGRTNLKGLEKAFIAHNIPYVIAGGIGYYQTQEIFDFCNYLKFLLNPHDDVALFGILRSPFFAVPDSDLFEISLERNLESLWSKVHASSRRGGELARAVRVLDGDLRCAHTLPITELIQRIIRQTAWEGTTAGLAQGRQYRANVEKLITAARDLESQGYVMLYDFVQRLQALINLQDKEGQASIESEHDAVKIMTIHSAKGLEFPVVFIPFMHRKFRFDQKLFLEPGEGIAFKIKDPLDYDEEYSVPFTNYLSVKHRMKTEAEEKRILYVACTRARDMLILSGERQPIAGKPNWMRWVCEGLHLPGEGPLPEFLDVSGEVGSLTRSEAGYSEERSVEVLRIPVRTGGHLIEEAALPGPDQSADMPRPEFFLRAPVGISSGEFFSATHIRTYDECPAKYFLKYRLGIPEQHAVAPRFDPDEDANDHLRGNIEGTITHAVLQRLTGSSISESSIRALIRSQLESSSGLAETNMERAETVVFTSIQAFLQTSFGKEVLGSSEGKAEFTLSTMFGKSYLTGTIDRLWKTPDGTWSIVDYKTDTVVSAELEAYSARYVPQLEVYAFLVSRYFRQPSVRATLLFLKHPNIPVHLHFDGAKLLEIERRIGKTISNIRSGSFVRREEKCATCSYPKDETCLLPKDWRGDSVAALNS